MLQWVFRGLWGAYIRHPHPPGDRATATHLQQDASPAALPKKKQTQNLFTFIFLTAWPRFSQRCPRFTQPAADLSPPCSSRSVPQFLHREPDGCGGKTPRRKVIAKKEQFGQKSTQSRGWLCLQQGSGCLLEALGFPEAPPGDLQLGLPQGHSTRTPRDPVGPFSPT